MMTTNETLMWSTVTGQAQLHASGCKALNRAGRSWVKTTGADVAGAVGDLTERGYPVVRCKCLRAAK